MVPQEKGKGKKAKRSSCTKTLSGTCLHFLAWLVLTYTAGQSPDYGIEVDAGRCLEICSFRGAFDADSKILL